MRSSNVCRAHKERVLPSSTLSWLLRPPVLIWAISPNRFTSHSPLKPGRRFLPVSNSCMAPCLSWRFLTRSCSRDSMRASASLNASAMASCSALVGGWNRHLPKLLATNLRHTAGRPSGDTAKEGPSASAIRVTPKQIASHTPLESQSHHQVGVNEGGWGTIENRSGAHQL